MYTVTQKHCRKEYEICNESRVTSSTISYALIGFAENLETCKTEAQFQRQGDVTVSTLHYHAKVPGFSALTNSLNCPVASTLAGMGSVSIISLSVDSSSGVFQKRNFTLTLNPGTFVGDRAFPVAGCRLWNSLPPEVTSASTLFFETASKLISFPDHLLPNCFRFLVLHTVYSSGLAVFVL